MHFIRSFAIFATILILPSVVFGSLDPKKDAKVEGEPGKVEPKEGKVEPKEGEKKEGDKPPAKESPVKEHVVAIDALVTAEDKKIKSMVELLSDDANWKVCETFPTMHLAGTKELVAEVNKILTPKEDATTIKLATGKPNPEAIKKLTDKLPKPEVFTDATTVKAFVPADYVKLILDILTAYAAARKADGEVAEAKDKVFATAPAVDELAKPLADTLDKIGDDKFTTDEQKAFLKKRKNASQNKPLDSTSRPMWHYLALIVVILAIVGAIGAAVYFLVVKPRKN
jgi:hypothetical protein